MQVFEASSCMQPHINKYKILKKPRNLILKQQKILSNNATTIAFLPQQLIVSQAMSSSALNDKH